VRAAGLEDDPRPRLEASPTGVIRTDAVRLRLILINLLTNADRHTPAGGTIDLTAQGVSPHVTFAVRNSGSSLDADQLSRVFDRFYRADPSRQRATGGSGLGLAIVKRLAEAMGGWVVAESDASSVTVRVALPG
jgi:two-component system sensor histidine kinase BaeS